MKYDLFLKCYKVFSLYNFAKKIDNTRFFNLKNMSYIILLLKY